MDFMTKDFESIPHTADIKIRVYGNTLAELFRNALAGMFQSTGPKSPDCNVKNERLVCPSLPKEHLIEALLTGINRELNAKSRVMLKEMQEKMHDQLRDMLNEIIAKAVIGIEQFTDVEFNKNRIVITIRREDANKNKV